MPIIMVYGIPNETPRDKIAYLCGDLRMSATKVTALKLNVSQVSCIFPSDLKSPTGEEIIIFVEGLFKRPERTAAVRGVLANRLVETARKFFPNAYQIECFVRPFDPANGFAFSKTDSPME